MISSNCIVPFINYERPGIYYSAKYDTLVLVEGSDIYTYSNSYWLPNSMRKFLRSAGFRYVCEL